MSEDDKNRFKLDGDVENGDDDQHDEEKEPPKSHSGLKAFFILILILFGGLLVASTYFLFYNPYGKFKLKMPKVYYDTSGYASDSIDSIATLMPSKVDSLTFLVQDLRDSIYLLESGISASGSQTLYMEGTPSDLVYEVQIGAFHESEISQYEGQLANMRLQYEDGYYKLTLGQFLTQDAAKAFTRKMKDLGLSELMIVEKQNGQRTAIIN